MYICVCIYIYIYTVQEVGFWVEGVDFNAERASCALDIVTSVKERAARKSGKSILLDGLHPTTKQSLQGQWSTCNIPDATFRFPYPKVVQLQLKFEPA